MSLFKVEVVSVKLEQHTNADTLSIANIRGWQVVVKTSDFISNSGGYVLGAYIPIDSVVPETLEWEFLKDKKYRVKTIKLRGILSQGLLIPAREGWIEGQDVTAELGVKKYEPPEDINFRGGTIAEPVGFTYHTDMERIQNYPNIFTEEDDVIVNEKVHGTNFRFGLIDNKFYVGSHTCAKKHPGDSIYSKIAVKFDLENKVRNASILNNLNIVIFGEIYGKRIQKLNYNLDSQDFIIFDVDYDGKFLNWNEVEKFACEFGFKTPPILYKGKFSNQMVEELAEGDSILGAGKHCREGIVIRSAMERLIIHPEIGRWWLKRISNNYLLKEK